MSLYEYECRICRYKFDKLQPVGARDFASCPKCSCVAEKKLSPINWSFGWVLSPECHFVKRTKDKWVKDVGIWKSGDNLQTRLGG